MPRRLDDGPASGVGACRVADDRDGAHQGPGRGAIQRLIPAPPDVARAPRTARRTQSGLAYRVLARGNGQSPSQHQKVEVHYTGWLTNGTMFDSSVTRGQPATFPLSAVIAGWTEMLTLMREGDTVRVWIPAALAYRGAAGKPAGTLVFDIQLLRVI